MLKNTGREIGEWSWVSVMAPTIPETATTSATRRATTITMADGEGVGGVAVAWPWAGKLAADSDGQPLLGTGRPARGL